MMQALPVGDYTSEDAESFDWRSLPDDGPRGALLTVELDFPPERHDLWRSFPPVAVAKTTPTWDMFSPYQQQHWGDAERPANPTLLGTLEPVREYTCHYRMLKTLESIGVVVSRVHKVQSFRQERGLFDYVNKCTQMRIAEAARGKEKSDCKTGFFKLMANSLYGKMAENVRGGRAFALHSAGSLQDADAGLLVQGDHAHVRSGAGAVALHRHRQPGDGAHHRGRQP